MEGEVNTDEKAKMDSQSHLNSAAAFVEGGIQDACDDACSICLEEFCSSDPSTVTSCKHEYHLQCILEWCQRSSQCPMCWQPLSLKDPTSQGLLEAVEQERNIRANRSRATALFHHPMLGDFELQNLPEDDAELEERLIQHLAAAAAIRRTHRNTRREGRGRFPAHGNSHIFVFSTTDGNSGSSASNHETVGEIEPGHVISPSPVSPFAPNGGGTQIDARQSNPASDGQMLGQPINRELNHSVTSGQSLPGIQDRAGPSDLQSFSESLKSRLNAVSARYKESITKNTRNWRERWFSRNNGISDLGAGVRNVGLAAVSRMMDRLETQSASAAPDSTSQDDVNTSSSESSQTVISSNNTSVHGATSTSCVSSSGSQ